MREELAVFVGDEPSGLLVYREDQQDKAHGGSGSLVSQSQTNSPQKNVKLALQVFCTVPGCGMDLSEGSHYLKRHKVCQYHLKAPSVVIDGVECRFCQQCGRFQALSEFRADRKSCEVALQAHNARRRVKHEGSGGYNRQRGSKRNLMSVAAADGTSGSSEDGAVGISRKSAPRRSSSQRSSGQPQLQRSSGNNSDGGRAAGSDGAERTNLSDGARTVEQDGSNSSRSPGNSFGSPEEPDSAQLQQQGFTCAQRLTSRLAPSRNGSSRYKDSQQHVASLEQQQHQLMFQGQLEQQPDEQQLAAFMSLGWEMQHDWLGSSMQPGSLPATASAAADMSGCSMLGSEAAQLSSCAGLPGPTDMQQASFALQQQQQHDLSWSEAMPANCAGPACEAPLHMQQQLHLRQQQQQSLGAWVPAETVRRQQQEQQLQQMLPSFASMPDMQGLASAAVAMAHPAAAQVPVPVQDQCGMASHLYGGAAAEGELASSSPPTGMDTAGPCTVLPAAPPQAILPPVSSSAAAAARAEKRVPNSSAAAMAAAAPLTRASSAKFAHIDVAVAADLSPDEADALLDETLDLFLSSYDWKDLDACGEPAKGSSSGTTTTGAVATPSSPISSMNGNGLSGPLSGLSLPLVILPQNCNDATAAVSGPAAAAAAGMMHASSLGRAADSGGTARAMLAASSATGMLAAASMAATPGAAASAGILPAISSTAAAMQPAIDSVVGQMSVAAAGGPTVAMGAAAVGGTSVAPLAPQASAVAGMLPATSGLEMGMLPAAGSGANIGIIPNPSRAMPAVQQSWPYDLQQLDHNPRQLVPQANGFAQAQQPMQAGVSAAAAAIQQPYWQMQHRSMQQQQLPLQQRMMLAPDPAQYLMQQQEQRRQQLLAMQQLLDSSSRYSQQLVRLSIKLHGVTPDQLPCSTVLAMERLLQNNAEDMEAMLLLHPSFRSGCVQMEIDVLVKCRHDRQQQKTRAEQQQSVSTTGEAVQGDLPAEGTGESPWPAPIMAAFNDSAAIAAAEAQLRNALPFSVLVQALLDLPLVAAAGNTAALADAAATDADDEDDHGDADKPTAAGRSSSSIMTPSDPPLIRAIYAQVGNCLGVWRADSGLLQDWSPQLPEQYASPHTEGGNEGTAHTAHSNSSSWRPELVSSWPLCTASPSPGTAAGSGSGLQPVQLGLHVKAPSGFTSTSGNKLWCTRRGRFLPVASAEKHQQPLAAGTMAIQALLGLPDAAPGLLLLQAEQQLLPRLTPSSTQAAAAVEQPQGVADPLPCLSPLVPLVVCSSAAMASEVSSKLISSHPSKQAGQLLLQLGLVLDYAALQQHQHERDGDSPWQQWHLQLLSRPQYRRALRSMTANVLLFCAINSMPVTAAYLAGILQTLQPQHGIPQQSAAAGSSSSNEASTAAVDSERSCQHAPEGATAAAAATTRTPQGLVPVHAWQFEDVDCKATSSRGDADSSQGSGTSSDGWEDESGSLKPARKPESRVPAEGESGTTTDTVEGLQSPLMILRGAAQMLAMLVVMYVLLEVVAAVYKGQSPVQQLLASLTQLRSIVGVMIAPLIMMCLGLALALCQFYTSHRRDDDTAARTAACGTAAGTAGPSAAARAAGKAGVEAPLASTSPAEAGVAAGGSSAQHEDAGSSRSL